MGLQLCVSPRSEDDRPAPRPLRWPVAGRYLRINKIRACAYGASKQSRRGRDGYPDTIAHPKGTESGTNRGLPGNVEIYPAIHEWRLWLARLAPLGDRPIKRANSGCSAAARGRGEAGHPARIHGVRLAITSTLRSDRRIAVRRPGVGGGVIFARRSVTVSRLRRIPGAASPRPQRSRCALVPMPGS